MINFAFHCHFLLISYEMESGEVYRSYNLWVRYETNPQIGRRKSNFFLGVGLPTTRVTSYMFKAMSVLSVKLH